MPAARRRYLLASFLLLGTALVACDDDEPPQNAPGSFEMDIVGDQIDALVRGTAYYSEATQDGATYFGIVFADADESTPDEIDAEDGNFGAFVRAGGDDITVQTYDLADVATDDIEGGDFFFLMLSNDDGYIYVSRGGTISVTARFANTIEGTFSIPASRIQQETEELEDVTLAGTFTAIDPEGTAVVFIPDDFDFFFGVPYFPR